MPLTVLLTGSEGFIGQHTRTRLLAQNCRVLGVDCLEPRVHQHATLRATVDTALCKSADTPYTYMAEADAVVHLAAQVGVADSMSDPLRYIQDNITDTTLFLEHLATVHKRRKRLQKLVVASSMSIYGDPGTDSLVYEAMSIKPASVYGLTKYAQERLCQLWGTVHDVPVVALRFWNVYGPGQALTNPYTGVLANFAQNILNGKPPVVYEDGKQTRDFVFVKDVANAIARCALFPCDFRAYNVCTGIPTTIHEAALMLGAAMDRADLAPQITGMKRHGDIRHCVGDNGRLKRQFPEWVPRPFSDGVLQYAKALRS